MSEITIVYYTNHSLEEPLLSIVQSHLKESSEGKPIVSVSHKPIDLGDNIAIGEQKSSWLLLYKQLLLGVERAKTKYVAMAEHDCLYNPDHFFFRPPRDDTFYYNENVWFVQWSEKNHQELKGMYSKWHKQRLALSALICNRELLEKTLNERLDLLDRDRKLVREIVFAGEPGLSKIRADKQIKRLEQGRRWAKSGRPVFLKDYLRDQLDKEKYSVWSSLTPILDIRHDNNFTGPRRGRQRTFELPYWGKFKDIVKRHED